MQFINLLSKFTVLVVVKFAEKKNTKKKDKDSKQSNAHNLLVSIVVFVCESYLFCDSCKCSIMESRNQQHHVYLSKSMMTTSNFEYVRYEYDIKISIRN